jgi:hypothetical protein
MLMKTDNTTSMEQPPQAQAQPAGGRQTAVEDKQIAAAGGTPIVATLKKCFSFPALLGTLLVVANFLVERPLRTEPDTWWHLKYGQDILQTGHFPVGDIYSFTAHGVFRMVYEWAGSIPLAVAYRLGGLRGLDVLLITLTSIIVLLIYYYAHLRCRNSKAAFLAAAAAIPFAFICFTLRPQLVGFILLLLTLICLERYRQGRQKSLWALPPIFLLWVNTHGTFALGLFILGVYWVSGLVSFSWGGLIAERWKPKQRIHIALTFLLSLAVLPITPYGTRMAIYPLSMGFSQPLNVATVMEWQPLPFSFWQTKFLLLLLLAFIIAVVTLRPTYRLEDIGLFLFATFSTLLHARFVILFAVLVAPIVAELLARWSPPYKPDIDKHAINAVLILGGVVLMCTHLPSRSDMLEHVAKDEPVHAVDYLRQHSVPGPMFNDYAFGGYLVWALGPKHQVFIDGRADLYEETGVLLDYNIVEDITPATMGILRNYGIRSCMVGSDTPLATLLSALPGWDRVYSDNLAAIFVRTDTSTPVATGSPK